MEATLMCNIGKGREFQHRGPPAPGTRPIPSAARQLWYDASRETETPSRVLFEWQDLRGDQDTE